MHTRDATASRNVRQFPIPAADGPRATPSRAAATDGPAAGSAAAPRRRAKMGGGRLLVDALESRRLLASASLNGNALEINGTSAAESIAVTKSGTDLVVTIDGGAGQHFAAASVATVVARLGGGNDSIRVDDTVSTPASLSGEAGDDTLRGGTGKDTIDGGDGRDTVTYAGRAAALTAAVTVGEAFPDENDPSFLVFDGHGAGGSGTENDTYGFVEFLAGGDGNDTLTLTGDIRYYHRDPNLPLVPFDLRVEGGLGDDSFFVNSGSASDPDVLRMVADGGAGNDVFDFNGNRDPAIDVSLLGGDGDDRFLHSVDDGNATIDAGAGTDTYTEASILLTSFTLPAGLENFTYTGGAFRLSVTGNALGNTITISGGTAATVRGGDGNDTLVSGSSASDVSFFGENGDDTLDASAASSVTGGSSLDGGAGNDTLLGSAHDDTLVGGAGNDRLDPGLGDDTADGGDGGDALFYEGRSAPIVGGITATVLDAAAKSVRLDAVVDAGTEHDVGSDVEVISGSSGDDTLDLYAVAGNWAAWPSNAGRVTLIANGAGGDDRITLHGVDARSVAMIANGGAGDDTLSAEKTVAGDTQLNGEAGDDALGYGSAAGLAAFSGGSGTDSISITRKSSGGVAPLSLTLPGDVEDAKIDSDSGVELIGNPLNNHLTVFAAGDIRVSGGAGDDAIAVHGVNGIHESVIDAGDGDDFVDSFDLIDTIRGGAGDDRLFGGAEGDKIWGGAGDDRVAGGGGKDNLRGEDGNDTLNGNTGSDRLSGGAGNDRLSGGDDRDTLDGEGGRDWLIGGEGLDVGKRAKNDRIFSQIEALL